MIRLKSKILVLAFAVFSFAGVAYEKLGRSDEYGLTQEIVPAVALENRRLSLISASPLFVGQETVGVMVVYEDTTTKKTSDYVEFYDGAGNLVAVIWFDQFGIERIGIDRGLLEGAAKLEGVFVVFLDGETV